MAAHASGFRDRVEVRLLFRRLDQSTSFGDGFRLPLFKGWAIRLAAQARAKAQLALPPLPT